MKIDLSGGRAVFREGAAEGTAEAGVVVLDDAFKPYVHPLRTPGGVVVSDAMPVDHLHHKGLMYALRAEDLNFWEEGEGREFGVQEVVEARAEGGTLVLELLWRGRDGGMETYREERRISCERRGNGFVWGWESRREALRGHRLIQSQWSLAAGDGRKINYHGLGIRLPWAWAVMGGRFSGVKVGGREVAAGEAHGSKGAEVTFWGQADGHWKPPRAGVTVRQGHGFAWFVLKGDFAYVAAGPSAEGAVEVGEGEVVEERYEVVVEDLAAE